MALVGGLCSSVRLSARNQRLGSGVCCCESQHRLVFLTCSSFGYQTLLWRIHGLVLVTPRGLVMGMASVGMRCSS